MSVKIKNRVAVIAIDDDITDDWWGVSYRDLNESIVAEDGNFDSVTVRISSNGGSVTAGMAIRNLLLRLAEDGMAVDVEIDGVAASIASIIALSGTSLKIRNGSYLMIHRPYTFAMGDHEELRNIATTVETMKDDLVSIYESSSNLGASEIEEYMDKETWFSASDAVEHGFASEVIPVESGTVLNYHSSHGRSVVMNSFKNVPKHILNSEVTVTAHSEPQHEGGEKMALKTILAKNPEDKREYDADIKAAEERGADGAKVANAKIVARVKGIVASDSYKAPVRALAMEVLAGEKDVAALDAVVAVLDLESESKSSEEAVETTAEVGETAPESQESTEEEVEAKSDGRITASNYKTFGNGGK